MRSYNNISPVTHYDTVVTIQGYFVCLFEVQAGTAIQSSTPKSSLHTTATKKKRFCYNKIFCPLPSVYLFIFFVVSSGGKVMLYTKGVASYCT